MFFFFFVLDSDSEPKNVLIFHYDARVCYVFRSVNDFSPPDISWSDFHVRRLSRKPIWI